MIVRDKLKLTIGQSHALPARRGNLKKIIITAALTGSLPTKANNPSVPISPDEIARDAYACYQAGASVIHIHARDKSGKATHDPAVFQEICAKIKALAPEVIVQLSTGGRAGASFESRRACLFSDPEMASLATGSVNFPTSTYSNPPQLIEQLALMMHQRNILPEIEVFDTSMIPPALDLKRRGLITGRLCFNFVMGMPNIQPASVQQLSHLLSMIPPDALWSISGIGASQIVTTLLGIAAGGNVRVGLEDNLYLQKGIPASNVSLVERAVRLAKEAGREIATPEQAREMFGF